MFTIPTCQKQFLRIPKKYQNIENQKWKNRYTDLQYFQSFRFSDMKNMFQGCSPMFLHFSKYFGDKYRVQGSIFGHIFGSSKNLPKSIAICPGVRISNLGFWNNLNILILGPPPPHNYIKKPRKTNKSIICFAVFWALLALYRAPYRAPYSAL